MTRVATLLVVALAGSGAAACRDVPALVRLEPGPPFRIDAAPGVRINARLKPALELDDGTVVRFDSPHVTPDSAYFTVSPTAMPSPGQSRRGTLRLSVCPSGEEVCRLVEMAVMW
ncbi:MAG TPA: hypothetical protein VJN39_01295 [Gemmatimonadales bacterium]|nr:hypothetical protein [Gemmatimonadales bacterium]